MQKENRNGREYNCRFSWVFEFNDERENGIGRKDE